MPDSCTTHTVASTNYPAAGSAQVSLAWETDQITVLNESSTASDIVFVSFDGVTNAGKLIPGIAQSLTWLFTKRQKVFLKLNSAGSVSVTVMAGTTR